MKFYTMDNTVLMDIANVSIHERGIVIEGKIMGTMPMKVLLKPEELQRGKKFLSVRLVLKALGMLFSRPKKSA